MAFSWPTRTPWSAPTRTRRWSTASACSAGASAASRPRRRCWVSRSRCCCRRWSGSNSGVSCRRGRRRPTSSSPRPRCCASAGSSPSSSSSSVPASPPSALPTGRRWATCRRSSARPARSSRSTPRRCATSTSPGARPRRSSWSTPTRASRVSSTTRARRSRSSPSCWSSIWATSNPASPARNDRRTGCRWRAPKSPSSPRWTSSTRRRQRGWAMVATTRSKSRFPPPTLRPRIMTTSAANRDRRLPAPRRRRSPMAAATRSR